MNIHFFSETTLVSVAWWIDLLAGLDIPRLLVVPNEPDRLLSLEGNGSRQDFRSLLEAAGYGLSRREPVVRDPAIRELLDHDHFYLFSRA